MSKLGHSMRLARDVWGYAKAHKAYWIIPMVLVLGLMTMLILGGQASAPFIYTLF